MRFGFSEWNSPGYYNEDLTPLFNLADFCPRPWPGIDAAQRATLDRIAVKAAMVLDLIVFDFARFTCRGSFGVTAGRAYWSAKAYGWEQSVGNIIEMLFGTRGEEDIVFWWSLGAYFTPATLAGTKRVVAAHPHLLHTNPFKLLYAFAEAWGLRLVTDMLGAIVSAAKIRIWWALPWPANVVVLVLSGENVVDDFVDLVENLWDAMKTIVNAVLEGVLDFLGFDGDDGQPDLPDSTVQKMWEALLLTFNRGSVLGRANLYTFADGDTMLSSTLNRNVGMPSAQTHPVQACLGLEACVWTTARFMHTDAGSFLAGAENLMWDFPTMQFDDAVVDIAAPIALAAVGNPFGNDGPNYWTGSFVLPMVVQHERAAIAIYDISVDLRRFSGAATHAWFPREMFDQTDAQDASDGTWFFGRKDTWTPDGAARTGSGYVALFSALQAGWTSNDSANPWNGKEIQAKGGSNIWIYVVGNEHDFGDFDTFRAEVLAAYLNISGVGTPNGLQCSFDMPRTASPAGRTPRLEAFYGDRIGRFAGADLQLDWHPRFESRYVRQLGMRPRAATGAAPQVQELTSAAAVGFGSHAYTLVHPLTGLSVEHDLDGPRRSFTSQPEPTLVLDAPPRRLVGASIAPLRVIDTRRRALAQRQVRHLNALSQRRLR